MSVLDGYRVLDLSIAMSGPFAAARLGDLGADVVKVEPTTGEWQRHVAAGGATGNRINVSFLSLNRNKRSLAVNLKDPQGREALLELARTADVFLQNYRPGVAERLGVDYESVKAVNPQIVYVSISGYGESGPYAQRPGQDLLLQGMSGFMKSAGRVGDPPHPAPLYVVDAVTASTAFEAVLAGLLHKERTGQGQLITVNMLDSIIALQLQEMSVYTQGKVRATRTDEPHAHTYIRAPYGAFETADREITLAFPALPKLGALLDLPELLGMDSEVDGFTQRDTVFRLVAGKLRERTAQEWLELFDANGIWAGPVYGYADIPDDPQVKHNGSLLSYEHPTEGTVTTPGFPIHFTRTPSALRHPTPLVGQHSRDILREAGISEERVDALLNSGAVTSEQV
ncbi:CoA transferase [Streptomyces sp. NBC_01511]|uniref:CaiB/BaiF CoA transferase family protein n=1 Tax=Streptomyces sp. NBC_01511 TaxID=2903889 RepID=UPI00386A986C